MLKLQAIGRIGADAEVRKAGPRSVIDFRIATTERYKDRNGEKQERTTWVKCSLWRDDDKTSLAQYLTKGTLIYVEGTPVVSAYLKDGEARASQELTVLQFEFLAGGKKADAPESEEDEDVPF